MRTLQAAAVLAVLLAGLALPAAQPAANGPKGIPAITRPSGDRTLSFVRPGLIMEMAVEKGDAVTKDQIVAKQDDREERELLLAAKEEAESTTEIDAEKKVLKADEADLARKRDFASKQEVREAELKVEVDAARIELAVFKRKQAQYKYQANSAAIEKLKLISPIDGVVQEVYMKAGEATNGQDMKVLRIIQVDPLWVEVPVPIQDARKFNPGDPAQVLFGDGKVRPGKVALKDRMADSASGTLNVRVAVPNPEKLEPGESVSVTFGTVGVAGGPVGR
jgi:RND family efflux transporter MFP subunit